MSSNNIINEVLDDEVLLLKYLKFSKTHYVNTNNCEKALAKYFQNGFEHLGQNILFEQ